MTTLAIRDPFLAAPFRLIEQWLGATGNGSRLTGFTPPLDVRETEDEFVVMADLPGVKQQDVTVEVHDQLLTISGARVPVETGEAQLAERPYGSFVRTLSLPKGVDSDGIVADYGEGVLTLHVPKPAEAKPKRISIGSGTQRALGE
jgi:HSP20 family protein